MPALEMLAGVAEQDRSRCHQSVAFRGSIVESARGHDGDGELRMLFLEGPIPRARGTDHMGNGPAFAPGEKPISWCIRTRRNFSQELGSLEAL